MELTHTRSVGGIVIGDHGTIAMVQRMNGNDAWLFPKGHLEPGEDDEEGARREVGEEAGLRNLELLDDLGSYARHPILPDGKEDLTELKQIHMYLFAAPAHSQTEPSMEMVAARWVPLQDVVQECGNVNDRAWFVSIFERVRQAVQRD